MFWNRKKKPTINAVPEAIDGVIIEITPPNADPVLVKMGVLPMLIVNPEKLTEESIERIKLFREKGYKVNVFYGKYRKSTSLPFDGKDMDFVEVIEKNEAIEI